MNVKGFDNVRIALNSFGRRVHEGARGAMRRSGPRIVERARLFVPEDTEALKNSIRIEKVYGDRGRLQLQVVAGDATVIEANGREINLDSYAAIIHEAYGLMQPGERTLQKMRDNPGVHIGEQFLTRAAEQEAETLREKIVEIIRLAKAGTKL